MGAWCAYASNLKALHGTESRLYQVIPQFRLHVFNSQQSGVSALAAVSAHAVRLSGNGEPIPYPLRFRSMPSASHRSSAGGADVAGD